eukprot:TRINITY_DN2551_c0_g1_i10.p1 TRINITY_DN2551_c0_g1~~TRINITY_DN2551_c0_g1_i10.p1  ORF type:complete len:283 (-),score=94.64 TRINITY_DN2551_c0_g1_i10:2187-3035(-)
MNCVQGAFLVQHSTMSHADDQVEEMEALEAIYMQDLTVHSSNPHSFSLWLVPHSDDSQPNHVAVVMGVVFPKDYPDVLPEITIKAEKDLEVAHEETLQKLAIEEAERNVGTVMVFSIAQAVKDWLAENNVRKLTVHEQAVQRKNLAKGITESVTSDTDNDEDADLLESTEKAIVCDTEEEAERKAHHGTPFSVDLFLAWKERFEKERDERDEKEAKEKLDLDHETRITGKKFFEMRAALHFSAGSGDENPGAPIAAAAEADSEKKVQWYDESLYADEDIPDE